MVQPSGDEEERGFQALLERVQAEVDAYGAQVTALQQKIDGLAAEFYARMNGFDVKLDSYTRNILAKVDQRVRELSRGAKS